MREIIFFVYLFAPLAALLWTVCEVANESVKSDEEEKEGSKEMEPSATEKKIVDACDALKELLLKKNADYGDSFLRSFAGIDPKTALIARVGDKVKRVENLVKKNGADPASTVEDDATAERVEEALDDAFRDLAGYCVLWRVLKGSVEIWRD